MLIKMITFKSELTLNLIIVILKGWWAKWLINSTTLTLNKSCSDQKMAIKRFVTYPKVIAQFLYYEQ
jgi:hypothetical protein